MESTVQTPGDPSQVESTVQTSGDPGCPGVVVQYTVQVIPQRLFTRLEIPTSIRLFVYSQMTRSIEVIPAGQV